MDMLELFKEWNNYIDFESEIEEVEEDVENVLKNYEKTLPEDILNSLCVKYMVGRLIISDERDKVDRAMDVLSKYNNKAEAVAFMIARATVTSNKEGLDRIIDSYDKYVEEIKRYDGENLSAYSFMVSEIADKLPSKLEEVVNMTRDKPEEIVGEMSWMLGSVAYLKPERLGELIEAYKKYFKRIEEFSGYNGRVAVLIVGAHALVDDFDGLEENLDLLKEEEVTMGLLYKFRAEILTYILSGD